jgi:hypothetical protein
MASVFHERESASIMRNRYLMKLLQNPGAAAPGKTNVIARPGKINVIARPGKINVIARPGKINVIARSAATKQPCWFVARPERLLRSARNDER